MVLVFCERGGGLWRDRSVLPFDLKLVSVKFDALGRAFPTLSFGFLTRTVSDCRELEELDVRYTSKSFFLSLFFFTLDPIVRTAFRDRPLFRQLHSKRESSSCRRKSVHL